MPIKEVARSGSSGHMGSTITARDLSPVSSSTSFNLNLSMTCTRAIKCFICHTFYCRLSISVDVYSFVCSLVINILYCIINLVISDVVQFGDCTCSTRRARARGRSAATRSTGRLYMCAGAIHSPSATPNRTLAAPFCICITTGIHVLLLCIYSRPIKCFTDCDGSILMVTIWLKKVFELNWF